MTELRDQLLAPVAVQDADGEVVGCDIGALVRRLVLFETYILDSAAMRELPPLIERIGADGFVALLESGALRIRGDAWTIGQFGQTDLLKKAGSRRPLPLGSYAFGSIVPSDREEHIKKCLGEIRAMTLGPKASQRVRRAIVRSLVPLPENVGAKWSQQFQTDVAVQSPMLKRSTALALSKRLGQPVEPGDFELVVQQVDGDVYTTETDIGSRFGLSDTDQHALVERGLLGAASVNQRLEEMEAYSAVMGFREGELPVLEEKFDFLASQLDPDAQEARFDRVVSLAGLPDVEDAAEIDIDRLLKIRNSEDCREFRSWLRRLDSATDEEIESRIASIREPIARAIHSKAGKAVRFAATTGVGFVPGVGPILGPAAGALDQFVLEQVVPEPGPISFLEHSYPSIFKS